MQRNALNKQIGEKRKVSISCTLMIKSEFETALCKLRHIQAILQKKEDATELQEKSVALKKQTEEAEVTKNELESKRDKIMVMIGNLVHDSVPVDNDEVCPSSVLLSATPNASLSCDFTQQSYHQQMPRTLCMEPSWHLTSARMPILPAHLFVAPHSACMEAFPPRPPLGSAPALTPSGVVFTVLFFCCLSVSSHAVKLAHHTRTA